MSTHIALASLPLHAPGVVRSVGGSRSFRRRLMELGLVPGTPVVVVNVAPLGDPIELRVRECRLSIRRAEAEAIAVDPDAAGAAAPGAGQ